jgi:hypothetical protein
MAYIGKSPDGTGVRSRFYYTQTSGGGTSVSGSSDDGTSLAFSDGAYVDVFLNGVLLVAGTDYNTSTANTIAGLAALANGDVVEVVVYDIFTVADTVSSLNGGTFSNSVTIDKDGGTALTVDRATSDGTIVDVQKDGTSVGNIGAKGGDLIIGTGDVGIRFHDANDVLRPTDQSTGSGRDNAIDIGDSGNRFKDLYLGGNLYIGGTGSANALEDYEEGTFTPTLVAEGGTLSVTYTSANGRYTKIGNVVHIAFQLRVSAHSGGSSGYRVGGLPFNASNPNSDHVGVSTAGFENHPIGSTEQLIQVIDNNGTQVRLLKAQNNAGWGAYTPSSSMSVFMSFTYPVA